MMSSSPQNLDEEARAELLCYLVVGQLVSRSLTGNWLSAENVVESARLWLRANGGIAEWEERLKLGQASIDFAPTLAIAFPSDETSLTKLFLVQRWRLDYRNPVVQNVYAACVEYLRTCQ
jgi:hypothetical protein